MKKHVILSVTFIALFGLLQPFSIYVTAGMDKLRSPGSLTGEQGFGGMAEHRTEVFPDDTGTAETPGISEMAEYRTVAFPDDPGTVGTPGISEMAERRTEVYPDDPGTAGTTGISEMPGTTDFGEMSGGGELDKQIARWMKQLSRQQPFASFRGAEWKRYPLGPGTHGWVVIVEKNGEEIGYLVVHAKPDGGFILTEYGHGPYPLFSIKTLIRTLEQHGLTDSQQPADRTVEDFSPKRVYIDPFQAIWEVQADGQTIYFDAVTGENYPLEARNLKASGQTSILPAAMDEDSPSDFSTFVNIPSADPFDHVYWVKGNPLSIDGAKDLVLSLSNHKKTTFVNRIFAGSIVVPLAVSGYQEWNNRWLYIVFSQEFGERSIPYMFVEQGKFYQK